MADKGRDEFDITINGVNSNNQAKINELLKALEIKPRNCQNINFIHIQADVVYFPKP